MGISNQEFLVKDVPSVDELKPKIKAWREQEKILDQWLVKRLDTVLPVVMKRAGIDCWVVCNNEYNEDPVYWTLTPVSQITARRLTILVFHLKDDGTVERFCLTHPIPIITDFYQQKWTNPKGQNWNTSRLYGENRYPVEETQMECLARVLKEINPEHIGLDISDTFAYADGLSHSLYQRITAELDEEQKSKIVSAENVAVGWLETRCEEEMAAYDDIVQIAHTMIAEAFSNKVIHPGVTTADDVKYWMMEKTVELGFTPWFDYDVSITRYGNQHYEGDVVILPGDMLHCDVGFRYLNLCTDTQELCYILKRDELDAPQDLKDALRTANRLQEITAGEFVEGRTGNEILAASLAKAKEEGIEPCIYTHPLGFHGHAAGPTIGLWDKQGGVPGSGDYPLYNNTAYSLELNAKVQVDSFGAKLQMAIESDILFKDGKVYYLAGRQENFHLVK